MGIRLYFPGVPRQCVRDAGPGSLTSIASHWPHRLANGRNLLDALFITASSTTASAPCRGWFHVSPLDRHAPLDSSSTLEADTLNPSSLRDMSPENLHYFCHQPGSKGCVIILTTFLP
jgi:hypothetical protein